MDLAFRGMDLLGLFQECRVRLLLNLLLNLPRNTLTQEAMSQDDELVEALIAERGDGGGSSAPRWSEFSPEVEAMYGVVDRLGDVVAGISGLGGKKPPRIKPLKRPETAWQRVEHKRFVERHERAKARLLPNG